jgi:hypothetical protein
MRNLPLRRKLPMVDRACGVALALALCACASPQRTSMERILQEGDCSTVPGIEQLAIAISDHGATVAFQWSGQRFAGTVQTSTASLTTDASYGANRAGEWEKRFPGVSATTTVPGAYLGFPAASNPRAGVFAATVYETQYPAPTASNRGVAVVNLKTSDTVTLAAARRVGSVAVSPDGEYVAVVEIAPATTITSWRDVFGLNRPTESPRYTMYATVYSSGGLVACTRELAARVPSPVVNVAWR